MALADDAARRCIMDGFGNLLGVDEGGYIMSAVPVLVLGKTGGTFFGCCCCAEFVAFPDKIVALALVCGVGVRIVLVGGGGSAPIEVSDASFLNTVDSPIAEFLVFCFSCCVILLLLVTTV